MDKKKEKNKNFIDISKLKVVELRKVAKQKGIVNISKLKKIDLIEEIKKISSLKSKKNQKPKENILNDNPDNLTIVESVNILRNKVGDINWVNQKKVINDTIKKLEITFIKNLENEKKVFIDKGGDIIDFIYKSKVKVEFDKIIYDYKRNKKIYFKKIEIQKKINSELKEKIINEIKELIGEGGSINKIYKKFKIQQGNWHRTGPALRSDENNLWETYKHHVERFYDFLHINRELRNLDYKHNYNEKIKLIEKAELLVNSSEILNSSKELNILHRLWKNDLGPVAPEHREELWKRFQKSSKIIHLKRYEYQKNIDINQGINLERKNIILKNIEKLTEQNINSHHSWQLLISKFNALRDEFKKIGSIPKTKSKNNWEKFREIGKEFNKKKNNFYKTKKINQKEIIGQYRLLIIEVKNINKKDDWLNYLKRMKIIQSEFNKLEFIPRNILKKLRYEFQNQTNLYFERLRADNDKINENIKLIYNGKVDLIKSFQKINFKDKDLYDFFASQWEVIENLGKLEEKLEQEIIKLFIKSIFEIIKEKENIKENQSSFLFDIELNCYNSNLKELNIKSDKYKKIVDELSSEINQLENNLKFFSKSSKESPLVKEVNTKLKKLSAKLFLNTERLNKIMIVKKNQINSIKKI